MRPSGSGSVRIWNRSCSGILMVSTIARWMESPIARRNSGFVPLRRAMRTRGMSIRWPSAARDSSASLVVAFVRRDEKCEGVEVGVRARADHLAAVVNAFAKDAIDPRASGGNDQLEAIQWIAHESHLGAA